MKPFFFNNYAENIKQHEREKRRGTKFRVYRLPDMLHVADLTANSIEEAERTARNFFVMMDWNLTLINSRKIKQEFVHEKLNGNDGPDELSIGDDAVESGNVDAPL